MTPIERLGLAALHRLDPERAHDLSILALRHGLAGVGREAVENGPHASRGRSQVHGFNVQLHANAASLEFRRLCRVQTLRKSSHFHAMTVVAAGCQALALDKSLLR